MDEPAWLLDPLFAELVPLLGRWSLRPRDELRESVLPLRLWLCPRDEARESVLPLRLDLFPLLLWR